MMLLALFPPPENTFRLGILDEAENRIEEWTPGGINHRTPPSSSGAPFDG